MKVTSTGIVHGVIADIYGKRGRQFDRQGMPTCSLPLRIEDAPAGTVSFALFLEDKDAVPVCGFSWIHWIAADITRTELLANESQTATDFVQGTNSNSGKLGRQDRLAVSCYGGMSPPDAPHIYELHVYALDTLLHLKKGFYMNELFRAMQGHILAQADIQGSYGN
ncbi:MAG: YbhB/YbcL family Raf kinase inhibitor-like protein [Clostridiaceae bacterium]|nr:YbhB/YbcL family Raf kinase inhibitor-like protein [Clostridiaceae bacterium]